MNPQGSPSTDISGNRRAQKWSVGELFVRALWETLRGPLFMWTPRQIWGWRRLVLRMFGARVGARANIHPSVRIAIPWNLDIGADTGVGDAAILYSLGMIKIGDGATVSQYAHICAGSHDYERADMPLLKVPVSIGAGAWVCADAFVGPGVSVGDFAIVGAAAVVTKDVAPSAIMAGNPAREIGVRPPLISR